MKRNDTPKYIKKIAEVKNISVAAEHLGISQPALSSYLKKVESNLGILIFDRSKQPLELTEADRVYIEYLDQAMVLHKELVQNLSDIENLKIGKLSIGGASFFNVAYLPKSIAAFAKEYPGIEIEIVDGKVSELVTIAQKGMLDLFITPIADEPDRFVYEELLEEKIYLAVPSDWEINKSLADKVLQIGGSVTRFESGSKTNLKVEPLSEKEFSGLCENTFIVLKSDQDIGRKMESLFRKFKSRPARTITAEQTMTTLALTQNGVGISLITESSIMNSHIAKLPALYLADPEICTRKMYIAYPKNKYMSRAATNFIRVLKEKI